MNTPLDLRHLNAFLDSELSLSEQLEMETRLEQDAALRSEVAGLQGLRSTVRQQADYHAASAALRDRIAALAGTPPVSTAAPTPQRRFASRPMGLALGLVLAALLTWGIVPRWWQATHDDRLMQQAIASHVRATLGQRLVDVASSDRHTVKPWLSARLDFSPPVHDLQTQGVVFLGGRVDYLDDRPVAVLVYKQKEHVIDAFIWPTQEAESPMRASSQRGFNARHWTQAGMSYWLVSDLNQDELAVVAFSLEHQDTVDTAR